MRHVENPRRILPYTARPADPPRQAGTPQCRIGKGISQSVAAHDLEPVSLSQDPRVAIDTAAWARSDGRRSGGSHSTLAVGRFSTSLTDQKVADAARKLLNIPTLNCGTGVAHDRRYDESIRDPNLGHRAGDREANRA